jgi:hypothetical protein
LLQKDRLGDYSGDPRETRMPWIGISNVKSRSGEQFAAGSTISQRVRDRGWVRVSIGRPDVGSRSEVRSDGPIPYSARCWFFSIDAGALVGVIAGPLALLGLALLIGSFFYVFRQ